MKSEWNSKAAKKCGKSLLKMRVYTSRLLGQNEDLVLHGGGNTSVKIVEKNIFGEKDTILYVKGSGWDLGSIEEAGFSPVKLHALYKLAELDELSDVDMVKYQRMAMTNPAAPNPSVETILHGIIPFTFVDHTHADAVVIISNTPGGRKKIEDIYGPNMLIVPYVMPGFILAKTIYEMTKQKDWDQLDGMILMSHGVFTFDDDAKKSYEKMISIVTKAEEYLEKHAADPLSAKPSQVDTLRIASIRKSVGQLTGKPILTRLDQSDASVGFSNLPKVKTITNRGPLTPDHIIRTKRVPLYLTKNHEKDLQKYVADYDKYFDKHKQEETKLDTAPRWAIMPGHGTLSFGPSVRHVQIIEDISRHTKKGIHLAESLGGWKALPKKDLFEVEYWSLEQAKLKKAGATKSMQGKVAVVTGAASGIGRACVERLVEQGAVVIALDINKKIGSLFPEKEVLGLVCDVTRELDIKQSLIKGITAFGGIDMLVSNAGMFPSSSKIAEMNAAEWDRSMMLNVTSHQRLMQACIPYLSLGFDPAIVIVGSKNVLAPGPGASAYSVAKAGLAQLGRVAALELGADGIRVNMLHPNAVFDTGVWSDKVLAERADHYGMSIQEYKSNNVLKTEINAMHVAELAVAMLGRLFSKVTGAQIPIDGGNDRVI